MKTRTSLLLAMGALLAAIAGTPALADPAGQPARSRVALSRSLPSMDGGRLQASIVEVAYGPGDSSPPHTHTCPVMVYVVEGAIRTKVGDEPEVIHRAGATFLEPANAVHEVSANASDRAPAKFVAFFVCDSSGPRTVPSARTGGR